ncbi:MAG: glycosyl hydrolase [Gemmatimonadota bacterium]|nr:MAG: glycosyl hydrolase [Gemmatimonadota bacterium]
MADKTILCVGTKRGLFLLESTKQRRKWAVKGPFMKGWTVHHAMIDTRSTPRLHVAAENFSFAANAFSGGLSGTQLKPAEKPPAAPELNPKSKKFAKQHGLDMTKRIWLIEPGPANEKKVLYAGTAPAGLFRSEDRGKSWEAVPGINQHRTRKDWSPGAGGQSLHSIQVDPHDPQRIYVAISAAGSFRTDDGGKRWKPINASVAKYVGAPKETTVGTCVHKLRVHPTEPGRLFQQNHVGVYRSDDHGDSWNRIDKGLPYDFGFGLALNPGNPEVCYVIPLQPEGYAFRATDGALSVFRPNGNGRGWKRLTKGLPQKNAYVSVLRQAMSSDSLKPCGIYFGTGGGQVFASADEGESWQAAAEYLPSVYSVTAAVV